MFFCREPLEQPVKPVVEPIIIEGMSVVEGGAWAKFVNARTGVPAAYDRAAGELKLDLGAGSFISFREGIGERIPIISVFAIKSKYLPVKKYFCLTDFLKARDERV